MLPELLRVTAGDEVSFKLKLAVKGGDRPADDVTWAVNQLLAGVREGFDVLSRQRYLALSNWPMNCPVLALKRRSPLPNASSSCPPSE